MEARHFRVVALLLFVAACHHHRSGEPPVDAAVDESVSVEGGAPGDQSGFGNDDLYCVQCSPDLRSVLDCQGNVLTTCPVSQGCGPGGTCEAACQSAIDDHSSVGCEYYAVPPPDYDVPVSCFAAYIANTWDTPVTIGADYNGATLDVTKFGYIPTGTGAAITYAPLSTGILPAGGVAILFLADQDGDCPGGVAPTGGVFADTGTGHAIHITTSAPVIAYDIYPYGGGSSLITSATLLLPVSSWDVNYVAVTSYPQTVTAITDASPWIAFVASQDGTTVGIKPTVAIAGGTGVAAAPANMATSYSLSKGEELRLLQTADLVGSLVVSNKPIGVWGGNTCANLPNGGEYCDTMHQQIPSVQQLGHEYAAVRYRDRVPGLDESPPWRVVGVVDGTTLTYDPTAPAGAPATINKGNVIEFPASAAFDIKSQDTSHPFYFGAHMTGCSVIGDYSSPVGCAGDPESVNVIPQEQYLSSYVFFTDPTYPETELVFVRKKGTSGTFEDVNLDCYGTLVGWLPVDSGDNYEYTRQDLVTGNFAPVGTCNNGVHQVSSKAPFTLTVWGWGTKNATSLKSEAVSYAYPAGAGLRTINQVVVPIQ